MIARTPLPSFKYHPDPVATGSIEESQAKCVCCGKSRGYIYAGPVFCEEELHECLCPWCIADGSAHERYGAAFTDSACIDGNLDPAIVDEVAHRTPGFSGWQQERWLACCNDAAAFLGRAGRQELESNWPEAIPSIQADSGFEGAEWQGFFRTLDRDGSPTAYVFRCLHCGRHLGYWDCD